MRVAPEVLEETGGLDAPVEPGGTATQFGTTIGLAKADAAEAGAMVAREGQVVMDLSSFLLAVVKAAKEEMAVLGAMVALAATEPTMQQHSGADGEDSAAGAAMAGVVARAWHSVIAKAEQAVKAAMAAMQVKPALPKTLAG